MFVKIPDRLFFILAALVVIFISFNRHQFFKSKTSSQYRLDLFTNLSNSLKNNEFDPESYWEFRERYSPGSFIRDEDNTDFFATFKIVNVADDLTPLFYYESELIRSIDGVIGYDSNTAIEMIKNEFQGEIVAQNENNILLKAEDNQYILVFVEPIDEMKKVMGTFDYKSDELRLLENKSWYNATYIKVK